MCHGRDLPSNGFERWIPAPITDFTTTTVTLELESACDTSAITLTYHWEETPCLYKQCAVYGALGIHLPAPPYKWTINNPRQ